MARIPDETDLGSRVIAQRRAPIYEDRSAEIAAEGVARTAESIGRSVQQLARDQDEFNTGRARSALLQEDDAIRKELATDPNWQTHESRYAERMKTAREEASKKIGGPRAKAAFDMSADADILRGTEQIREGARKVEGQWARSELDTTLEANRKAALETKDEATRVAMMESTAALIRGARDKMYITPEQAVQVEQAWKREYGEGYLTTLPASERVSTLGKPEGTPAAFVDPARRAQMLREAEAAAEDDAVKVWTGKLLGAYEQDASRGINALESLKSSGLTDSAQLEVRSRLRAAVGLMHAERRQQYGEDVTALERSISVGRPSATAEQDANSLYRRGAYSAEQYTNVLQQIDTARQKGAKDEVSVASFQEALLSGKRLDPKDEKIVDAADKWFAAATVASGIEQGSDQWVNSAAEIAKATNILPPSAMSWGRAALLSNEPALAVPAANAMRRWADAAPTAYAYFDDSNIKAQAEGIDALVRVGVKPEKAVEIARANTEIPKARKDALQATYTKEKHAASNVDSLQERMDSDDLFDVSYGPGGAPPPSLEMRDEYGALVRTYYDKTNGDIAQARELAWKDMRGVYGYSTVNGAPEILKYAPEKVFPGIDVSVIRKDLEQSATAAGIKTPVGITPAPWTGDTKGLKWMLKTVDADGNIEILRDAKNDPITYMIPTDTSAYVKTQEDAKAKAVAEARTDSARRRATLKAAQSIDILKNEAL